MNELTPYKAFSDPMVFVQQMGSDIAKSKLFGCDTIEQGRVLALECYVRQLPPLALAERYDLIFGRLSMKSEAMLADFRQRFGKAEIIARTPDKAAIQLTRDDETQVFTLTWKEAQKEPFPYEGRERDVIAALAAGQTPPHKAKYATPRSRMQMLWHRVVSDAVRTMASEVTAGAYVPEEIDDFGTHPNEPEQVSEPIAVTVEAGAGEIVTPPVADHQGESVDFATAEQTQSIRELYEVLNVPYEKQQEILAKRNSLALRNLTQVQAAELIEKLEAMVDKSREPEPAYEAESDGPVGQTTIDEIKAALSEAVQNGMPSVAQEVKDKLTAAGLNRIADMTHTEATGLLRCIRDRAMQAFFDASLSGHGQEKN